MMVHEVDYSRSHFEGYVVWSRDVRLKEETRDKMCEQELEIYHLIVSYDSHVRQNQSTMQKSLNRNSSTNFKPYLELNSDIQASWNEILSLSEIKAQNVRKL